MSLLLIIIAGIIAYLYLSKQTKLNLSEFNLSSMKDKVNIKYLILIIILYFIYNNFNILVIVFIISLYFIQHEDYKELLNMNLITDKVKKLVNSIYSKVL